MKSQFCYFKLQWKSISVIRVFRSWKLSLQWFPFAWGSYLIFRSNLSGFIQFIFLLNSRNNEIIKIVLGIFITMKKPFYTNNHFRLQTWTFSATRGPVIIYRRIKAIWLTFSWSPLQQLVINFVIPHPQSLRIHIHLSTCIFSAFNGNMSTVIFLTMMLTCRLM